MNILVNFIYFISELPLVIQLFVVLMICYVIGLIIYIILRKIEITICGGKNEYFKASGDPLTWKTVFFRAFIISIFLWITYIAVAFF